VIRFPGPVPADVLAFFANKGLKVSFDWRDVWRQEHASAFTVAKAMQLDVLEAIRLELDRAILDGRTLRDFRKDLTPTLQRLGWWGKQEWVDKTTGEVLDVQLGSPRRLRTIYNANLRTARAAGQWDRAQRNKAVFPYLKYGLGPSEQHRELHQQWDGTILPVDHPWWSTHLPPNGWGCKCGVRSISRAEMAKKGWEQSGNPLVRRKTWVNERTGKTTLVPEGIDPGWDTNPGQTRQQNLQSLLDGKLKTADPQVAETARRDLETYRSQNPGK
jgi:uncharacterized protein with gpF-like domain